MTASSRTWQATSLAPSKSSFMLRCRAFRVFAVLRRDFRRLWRSPDSAGAAGHAAARRNGTACWQVAEAYFNVQRLAANWRRGGRVRRAEDVVRKTEKLSPAWSRRWKYCAPGPKQSRRRQAVQSARERWRIASADLARVLRLEPTALVEPLEPPHLLLTLVPADRTVDELVRCSSRLRRSPGRAGGAPPVAGPGHRGRP